MSTTNTHCRSCSYYGSVLQSCDYLIVTGQRRGCPAGKECTRYKKRGTERRKPIMMFPNSNTFSGPIPFGHTSGGRIPKKVKQMDMDGNLIKIWDSASDACSALNIGSSNLHRAARGQQKSSHGFRWEYVKEGDGHESK